MADTRIAIIVIESIKNTEHRKKANDIAASLKEQNWNAQIVDISKEAKLHELYFMLQKEHPSLVITLDLAGFSMKTELGNIAYNKLFCRMAHILYKPCESYGEQLKQAFNFSMFFYTTDQNEVNLLKQYYPNIEHVGYIPAAINDEWTEIIKNMLIEMQL